MITLTNPLAIIEMSKKINRISKPTFENMKTNAARLRVSIPARTCSICIQSGMSPTITPRTILDRPINIIPIAGKIIKKSAGNDRKIRSISEKMTNRTPVKIMKALA